jgi:hypothetical protein
MRRDHLHIILILLLILPGCEKQYDWNIKEDSFDRLVVDGIVTNELKAQEIKLTRTNQYLNLPSIPVSGAEISVSDGQNTYIFSESEPGVYLSLPFQAAINNTYQLTINLNDHQFTASSEVEPVTPMEDINYVWDESKYLYRFIPNEHGKPSMTEIYYNWSGIPWYCESTGSCYAQETFYVLDNIDVNAVFGPEKEKIYFPAGTELIRRKYGITHEHQQFIRSLLMETEWRGGVFDVLQGNVPTNLSNGALGYFAACTVISDTTIVN